jgi:hypothetical protein
MDKMENKLNSLLSNPQLMQQVMALAQSLGDDQTQEQAAPVSSPAIDANLLKTLGSLAGQSGIDREQQALLQALHPYLSHHKVAKLEKAMRAAKMARMASGFLGQGGLSALMGG